VCIAKIIANARFISRSAEMVLGGLSSNDNICATHILQSLVFLLQFRVDLHKSLLSLVELVLNGLDLLLKSASFFLGLYEESRHFSLV